MSKNVDLDAKSRSSTGAPPATYQSPSCGELPEIPVLHEPPVAPSTPGWPGTPKCPEEPGSPEPPESPVPPVSGGHDDEKALKMLAGRNACQARNTARKRLWQLARDLSALERKVHRELEIAEIIVASDEWYRLSQPFLDSAKTYDTYLAALTAALRKVRVPTGEGETIEKALASVSKLSPSQLPMIPGYPSAPESWRRVAALHRELSRLCRSNTYFLSCRHGAKAYSGLSYQALSDINHSLERLGVIKLVRAGDQRPNGKASEFRYLLTDANTDLDQDEREVEI
jgi:hypothetical protein